MRNVIEIDGHKAVVSFDPDIAKLRGEFLGLSGGADFYAASVEALAAEGRKSLEVYLEVCREKGFEPFRSAKLARPRLPSRRNVAKSNRLAAGSVLRVTW